MAFLVPLMGGLAEDLAAPSAKWAAEACLEETYRRSTLRRGVGAGQGRQTRLTTATIHSATLKTGQIQSHLGSEQRVEKSPVEEKQLEQAATVQGRDLVKVPRHSSQKLGLCLLTNAVEVAA